MWWLLVVTLVVVAIYCAHRLALWAESRGWVYYRTHRMPPGAAGLAMMEIAAIVDPATGHLIEELRSQQSRAKEDESGLGPPGPGD